DHVRVRLARRLADQRRELDPIQTRHHPIGDHDREMLFLQQVPRFGAGLDHHDVVPACAQTALHDQPERRIVVRGENPHGAIVMRNRRPKTKSPRPEGLRRLSCHTHRHWNSTSYRTAAGIYLLTSIYQNWARISTSMEL